MPDCICGAREIDLEGHECIPSLRAQLAEAKAKGQEELAPFLEAWKKRAQTAELSNRRLREALKSAPHTGFCASQLYRPCDCWKSQALNDATGEQKS